MKKENRMYIQITEKYRITADPLNIIIEKLITPEPKEGEETKEPYWVSDNGYYPNMEQAIVGILNREINNSTAQDLFELKQYIGEVKDEILDSVRHAQLSARTI